MSTNLTIGSGSTTADSSEDGAVQIRMHLHLQTDDEEDTTQDNNAESRRHYQ